MNFEESIINEGLAIFNGAETARSGMFNKAYWTGQMLDWVMKDPAFKVDLFRFVDVLPALTTDDQITKHLQEYLLGKHNKLPGLMNTAIKAASLSFAKGLAATAIKKNVIDMARRFIAGTDLKDAKKPLSQLSNRGFSFTIDLLGEKTLSDQEADDYQRRYHELIVSLPQAIDGARDSNPPNISLKISALSCRLMEEDVDYSVSDVKRRVIPLLRCAKEHHVFVNFDVESYQTHEIIYRLFHDIASLDEFRSFPHLGIVVQAYLQESLTHLNDLISLCKLRKTPITIRLVKGAYWDYEMVKAEQLGHRAPVFQIKAKTDLNYERLSRVMLDNVHLVRPAFGSHNIRSLAHAIAYANSRKVDRNLYEIQMLYGMAEGEREVILKRGHQVRIYVPLGEMLPGMSYLVRRLLENTSQMGFLKLTHHDHKDIRALLVTPTIDNTEMAAKIPGDFVNAPYTDFTHPHARDHFNKAISTVRKQLSFKVPIVIDGEPKFGAQTIHKMSPGDLSLKIAECHLAQPLHVDMAVASSMAAYSLMHDMPIAKRVQHLHNLADILTEDRFLLAATICLEVGKTWAEADADVAEAIDFCRYYAHCAQTELRERKLGYVAGEDNLLTYRGRGPTVVIAPWNFPLAIICGMGVAAYVAGNPIILKPAEQSMATAYLLYERMIKAQFVKSAVQFLPGVGEDIGPKLVLHKDVANICFTGSMKVGHEITKLANTMVFGQRQMKRVICEMGGKNAIIVDDDADLDEAVISTVKSAFSYAGQKCSAASRVIVIGSIKEQFLERLINATKSFTIGSPAEPSTFMGPVIDQDAFVRLNHQMDQLKTDPSVVVRYVGETLVGGYFIPPMIVSVTDPNHWVMQEEIFGPILAVMGADTLEQAVNIANDTRYALTGAFISRSPANIAYVRRQFSVGNLYINQKCTGAIVGRQPFGGFKMSGTGIKAGGPGYLLNLADAQVVCENTMRQGFTPEFS